MGRGNVSVSGPYEGLFYIDNDHIHVYRRDDPLSDEPETMLMGSLSSADINTGAWVYDEWGTMEEEGDVLECFMDSFGRMFPSFARVTEERWVKNGLYGDPCRRVIWRAACSTLRWRTMSGRWPLRSSRRRTRMMTT